MTNFIEAGFSATAWTEQDGQALSISIILKHSESSINVCC